MCTQRLVKLAHETGKRVHVLHVTTREEAVFLAGHKDVATCEATPSHLTLAAPECYRKLGTLAQLNPPVRDAAHRDGIWSGLNQGVIDTIGSDHSPHTREEKAHPYPKTHSGMTGVQTLFASGNPSFPANYESLGMSYNVNGQLAAIQPMVPHKRTGPKSFCGSFIAANAIELVTEIVGT